MREVLLNGRWPLVLPEARAARSLTHPMHEDARLVSMHERLRPGAYIVDCGAEQGDFAALFATWGCTVGLIEPLADVWPTIRAVWEANVSGLPVFSFPGFVSDGMRAIWAWDLCPKGWPICAYDATVPREFPILADQPDAPCVTIDYLTTALGPPDAITIDVEGAEYGVLEGAIGTLSEFRPLVWVSVHPALMTRYDTTETMVHAFMAGLGYRGVHLADDHERHYLFEPN